MSDAEQAKRISEEISQLEKQGDERLKAMGLTKRDFEPKYKCSICNDTGYDKNGKQCECLKRFIKINKL